MSTHINLPEMLIKEIDSLVGQEKRKRFIEEAVREKLRSEVLLSALEATAGTLLEEDYPEWATGEQVASWVRETRKQADGRM